MSRKIDTPVPVGCIAASATAGEVLAALGLGSCVGVALRCSQTGAVGIAHVYLPSSIGGDVPEDRPAKFADTAVPLLVAAVEACGGVREHMTAFLVGGAQMFEFESKLSVGVNGAVGMRNDEAVRAALAAESIAVAGAETGGVAGRSMRVSPGLTWANVLSGLERSSATLKMASPSARGTTLITPKSRGNLQR